MTSHTSNGLEGELAIIDRGPRSAASSMSGLDSGRIAITPELLDYHRDRAQDLRSAAVAEALSQMARRLVSVWRSR